MPRLNKDLTIETAFHHRLIVLLNIERDCMNNRRTNNFTLILAALMLMSFGVVDDLRDHIGGMEPGETMLLEYSFEGCYGPYHHGTIEMRLENDTVYFVEKSFDHDGRNAIIQSGKYHREQLLNLLQKTSRKNSSEIYGNTITYRLSTSAGEIITGADRIEQRHFIELFHPFTSIFSLDEKEVIPGLKTGGFKH